jgi:L-asparaginase
MIGGMRKIMLMTTGGTIEKTYDERTGELSNRQSIVRRMLRRLHLEDTEVTILELMSKDSLDLTPGDRHRIAGAVEQHAGAGSQSDVSAVVILHGTDTLQQTGELLLERIPRPRVPIVLTGALRPFEMKRSDALQNLNEAIFATGLLEPGVYCVAHGRALPFPGVYKDRERGTFRLIESSEGRGRDQ